MGRVLRVAVVILSALSLQLFAQKAKVLAPHRPISPKLQKRYPLPPAVQSSMVGGPWIVDASFNSSIYLRNVVETSAVTITPILYLSNGAKYTLPDVQLQPSQTTTVDLNAALANLGIAPYATLSGYVELQYTWPWDPICATIRNLDTVHSLIFDYSFRPSKALQLPNQPPPPTGPQTNVAEGMWWKQEADVTGFVALANTTNQPIKAALDLSDGQGQPIAQHQVTISPHGMKTLALDELASAPTAEGGIRVTYTGNSTDVLINGGLQDQVVGYSAVMPFTPASAPASAARTTTSVAEIGLMSGPADPMMKFPAGIVFTPYSILRNVSSSPLTAAPTLWWMAEGTAQSAQLPALTLAPYETRTLDVPAMLTAAKLQNYNGNVNLVFDLQGNAGALLMAGGSVDQNNTYVFEVAPHGVSESASKSLSYWSTGNGNDTMVTLWNPSDEAQDLVFRLTFTGGHYLFPMHLDARATQIFNISQLIQNQVPDSEGSVVPLAVNEGGAVLSGSQADNQHILVVMDAGTYNVKKATCGWFCQTCDGVTGFAIADDPFAVAVGGNVQETMYATWDNGSQSNETSSSSWSSSNTTLATVFSGVVTGMAVGTPNITAVTTTSQPGYSDICEGGWYSCPVYFTSGPGTSPGTIVQLNCAVAVIRGGTETCTLSPSTVSASNWQFTDTSLNVVNRTINTTSLTWSGTMVASGTVTVAVSGASSPLSASVAVLNRNWHTAADTAHSVPNDTFIHLQVPPVPTGSDAGLGKYHEETSNAGTAHSTVITDNGPNNGYAYWATPISISTLFQYEINPDLTNSTSTFSTNQWGACGFISWANLNAQTQRHEFNSSTQSHYSHYTGSLSSHNPGDFVEQQIAPPGADLGAFATNTGNGLTSRFNEIFADTDLEPFAVNESESGTFLGNINYSPYATCP